MIEPRLLPQYGTENKDSIAGSGNGSGGDQRRNIHAGVFAAPVHDQESVRVQDLRADGKDGPSLGLGIGAWLLRVMSNWHGSTRVFQAESNNNGGRNLQLVPTVSELPTGAAVASRRYSICYLDSSGDVDVVPHQTWVMPQYLLFKAAMAAGAVAVTLFALLENLTSWGDKLIGAVSTVVAASFAYMAVLAKNRYDRWKDLRSDVKTDAQSLLEREKLADDRIKGLITEMQAFHAEQVKGLQSSIELLKELNQQDKGIITQQRELISQQAQQIHQLQKGG